MIHSRWWRRASRAPLVALALSLVCAPLVFADGSGEVKGKHVLVGREGSSFLEEIDGQRVLHLTGDHYAMGFAHGKLLAKEARECLDGYLRGFALTIHKVEQLRELWEKMKPHISPEYLDEMRGLAEGSGIP